MACNSFDSFDEDPINQDHEFETSLIEENNKRVIRAINSYQEAHMVGLNGETCNIVCDDIIKEQLREDTENYDNFLRPEMI